MKLNSQTPELYNSGIKSDTAEIYSPEQHTWYFV